MTYINKNKTNEPLDDGQELEPAEEKHPSRIEHLTEEAKEAIVREAHEEVDDFKREVETTAHDIAHPIETVEEAAQRTKNAFVSFKHRTSEAADEFVEAAQAVTKSPEDKIELPRGMKVLGVLCVIGGAITIPAVVITFIGLVQSVSSGSDQNGIFSIAINFVLLVTQIIIAVTFIIFGVSLLKNRRRLGSIIVNGLFALVILGILCSITLYGMSWRLLFYISTLVLLIALNSYLDPSLSQERKLQRQLHDAEERRRMREGTLGKDPTGKGYITLNFYNLFWIFVVSSIIGLIIETVFHYIVFGEYQDRAGLLFGPFSPIYGCGACLMTIFLNRFHHKNIIIIFLISAVIGGAFEYFTSVFMQYAYGAVAWNYTGMWLSIGGRTCGLFMCLWGLLGVIWIKILLPILLRIVNLIPWQWRYTVTTICAILMAVDAVMTLEALDCWYERLSGDPVTSPMQHFYADYFDNAFMQNRFQSMTIHPGSAIHSG